MDLVSLYQDYSKTKEKLLETQIKLNKELIKIIHKTCGTDLSLKSFTELFDSLNTSIITIFSCNDMFENLFGNDFKKKLEKDFGIICMHNIKKDTFSLRFGYTNEYEYSFYYKGLK